MRVISDELHAQIIKLLLQDEKVSLFQKLLMAAHADEPAPKPEEKTEDQK